MTTCYSELPYNLLACPVYNITNFLLSDYKSLYIFELTIFSQSTNLCLSFDAVFEFRFLVLRFEQLFIKDIKIYFVETCVFVHKY